MENRKTEQSASPSSRIEEITQTQANIIISLARSREALWNITAPELSGNTQMYRALWNGLMSIVRRVHPEVSNEAAFRVWKQFRDQAVEQQDEARSIRDLQLSDREE